MMTEFYVLLHVKEGQSENMTLNLIGKIMVQPIRKLI